MEWKTRVTELLDINYPIVQRGLAHLAYAGLAAAVANAGVLGQITAMTLADPAHLAAEIQKVKTLTSKPFGVHFAIGQSRRSYTDMVEVAIAEQVPVISIIGGNPQGVLDMVKGKGIRTLVQIGRASCRERV